MREYVLVLLVALSATFLAAPACRSLALRTGAVAKVRDRDVHARPVPYFGGLSMLVGVSVALVCARQLPFLGRHQLVTGDSFAILLAGAVICGVGVLDDLIDLPALAKAAGQVLAAGIAVLMGVRILWIPVPGRLVALDQMSSIAITVFLIFVCVNAINFVDGLDGLAAGVVAIGSLAFAAYTYVLSVEQDLVRATTASLVTVAMAGACLGYLPHNFFPARMFMGDSGAMLLGLLLATSTVSLTGQMDPAALADQRGLLTAYLPILLPVAILALPVLDLVMAYVRRTIAGKWWFHADKMHLHHRLLHRGHSQTRAVLVMYLWTALLSFGAIAVGLAEQGWVVALVLGLVAVAVVLTLVPGHRRTRREPDPDREQSTDHSR
ncbi:MAG: MraY family glycosyltransferase, partial [Actinomycetia bacterium]|nr:MraY family glycosyltransferase [Actinomycetes bacterium]